MAQQPWPPGEVVSVARTRLLADGAVTHGFQGLDVREEQGSLLVVFRWMRDPNAYAVRFPLTREGPGHWLSDPPTHESAESWVEEVGEWLVDSLETQWVYWARRTRLGTLVELDREKRGEHLPRRRYIIVDAVHQGSPVEEWVDQEGLNIRLPQRLRSEDRLLIWVVVRDRLSRAGGYSAPVGHAVISRDQGTDDTAVLELLEVTSKAPTDVRRSLALHAVYDAAGEGCLRISTTIDDPVLAQIGFRPSSAGAGFTLDTTAIEI